MKRMKLFVQLAGLAAVLAVSNGCALTKANIGLNYQPQPNVPRVAGAEGVTVAVTMSDQRAVKDSVGNKKNGYGMEMAPIIATNDVVALVQNAIETELANRGFKLGAGSAVNVTVQLNKFYNDFKVGFWSGNAVAELTMNVMVKNREGLTVHSALISVQGTEPSIQLASGGNAQLALDAALKNAMAELFKDSSFTDALLKTGGRPEAAAPQTAAPSTP